jgi:hypothetical protein
MGGEDISDSNLQRTPVNSSTAVTNARLSPLHRLSVGPFSLSTTPLPLHQPGVRHKRDWFE